MDKKYPGILPPGFQKHYSALPQDPQIFTTQFQPVEQNLSSEDRQLLQKKCKRCGLFYNEKENGTCRYHPGRFDEFVSVTQGSAIGWSCCRYLETTDQWSRETIPGVRIVPIINEKAVLKSCVGCKAAEKHLEDEYYSAMLSSFPFEKQNEINPTTNNEQNQTSIENKKEEENQKENNQSSPKEKSNKINQSPIPDKKGNDYIEHTIKEGETLQGLSLKYDVSMEEIKRLNRLPTNDIWHLKKLFIPTNEKTKLNPIQIPQEENLAWKKKQFKQKNRCYNGRN